MIPNTLGYEVLRNQWIVLALFGGISIAIAFILVYLALWRPRELESRKATRQITGVWSFLKWIISFSPWVLILALLSTVAYSIIHVLAAALHIPNW